MESGKQQDTVLMPSQDTMTTSKFITNYLSSTRWNSFQNLIFIPVLGKKLDGVSFKSPRNDSLVADHNNTSAAGLVSPEEKAKHVNRVKAAEGDGTVKDPEKSLAE